MSAAHTTAPGIVASAQPFTGNPYGPDGKWRDCAYFDFPVEEYAEGNLTGMKAFVQFMAALERREALPTSEIIVAAVAARAESGKVPSRRGAAVGFLSLLVDCLTLTAMTRDDYKHIAAQRIERLQAYMASEKTRQAAGHVFAQRMRAARQAEAATASQNGAAA